MIIDVKDWNRRLQDAIDKAFPGKKLKIDENTKSLTRMVKDSLEWRGIAADKAAQQKEILEILTVLRASDLGDDLGLYLRAFGGHPKPTKSKPSEEGKPEPSKKGKIESSKPKNANLPPPKEISPRSEEYIDIYDAGQRLPGSYGSNQ
jgi:hypothetical protein